MLPGPHSVLNSLFLFLSDLAVMNLFQFFEMPFFLPLPIYSLLPTALFFILSVHPLDLNLNVIFF